MRFSLEQGTAAESKKKINLKLNFLQQKSPKSLIKSGVVVFFSVFSKVKKKSTRTTMTIMSTAWLP